MAQEAQEDEKLLAWSEWGSSMPLVAVWDGSAVTGCSQNSKRQLSKGFPLPWLQVLQDTLHFTLKKYPEINRLTELEGTL